MLTTTLRLGIVFVLALALPGLAATFTVNATDDRADADPTDGRCDADLATTGDQCTLRAAVQQANASPGPDTIMLPAGTYRLTRAGAAENAAATGDLDLFDDVTVVGAGSKTKDTTIAKNAKQDCAGHPTSLGGNRDGDGSCGF